MRQFIPALDEFGDAALPLDRYMHRKRHKPRIVAEEGTLSEEQRFRILQGHCAKKGRRHDFSILSREGLKCLWCGIVRAES